MNTQDSNDIKEEKLALEERKIFEGQKRLSDMILAFNKMYLKKRGNLTKVEAAPIFCDILTELITVGVLIPPENIKEDAYPKPITLEFDLEYIGTVRISTINIQNYEPDRFNLDIELEPHPR